MAWFIGLLLGAVISCFIAHVAGGGRDGAFLWGVLGPVGWVIAAITSNRAHGESARPIRSRAVVESRRRRAETKAAQISEYENEVALAHEAADRTLVADCGSCGAPEARFRISEIGSPVECAACGAVHVYTGGRPTVVVQETTDQAALAGAVWATCDGCGFKLLAFEEPAASADCPECHTAIAGYMLTRGTD